MISVLAHFGSLALISFTGYALIRSIMAESGRDLAKWWFISSGLILTTALYFMLFLPR